ncbi:MAG: YtxH domain-containing protein [Gemmatimonadota bacterium]|jgi:gas vesicle protein|nr:MAG: YtxH domain-containing protein [Gemmatimonadota bacterium]
MFFDDGEEFVLGVIVGALIGASAALLLAPDSGRRTRRRIRRSAEDLTDAAGERIQEAADDARRLAGDARRAAERSSERLVDSVERGAKRLRIRT